MMISIEVIEAIEVIEVIEVIEDTDLMRGSYPSIKEGEPRKGHKGCH